MKNPSFSQIRQIEMSIFVQKLHVILAGNSNMVEVSPKNLIFHKITFTAFPCESYDKFEKNECFTCGNNGQECGRLGYYSNLAKGRGSLYLMTRDGEPFCGQYTMLQKISKCEVKALTLLKFDDFTASPILHKIKFWQIQTVQNVIFGNFRDCEL